jgi:leucyl aminopeptidase
MQNAFNLGDFSAKAEEQFLFYPAWTGVKEKPGPRRILVMGMGRIGQEKDLSVAQETLRRLGGDVARVCERIKAKTVTVRLPSSRDFEPQRAAECLTEGVMLGDYRFVKYRETVKKKTDYNGLRQVQFAGNGLSAKAVRKGLKKGFVAARAACEARDMANEPGNGWTSSEFAGYARNLAKTYGFTYTCIEKKEMKELGMGGILAVNQGSDIPPRLVILEYKPGKKSETILLVGKGVTFDSGGISIKPSSGMEEMKYDMCGGAAVLATMQAVGEEKPDVGVIAVIPATDNMSGSAAVRPGDIIRHFNRVTAEIVNTDAEGRMILADALAWAIKTYAPDCVVDIATLTGAVVTGLGHHHSGLLGNNDALADRLISAGKNAGEPFWRLPLTEDYKRQIESKVADIKNTGGRPGGTITAAAYLSHFVGKTPWVHLDIAGTAWDFTEKSYIPKGPSGFGVRTFINLIRGWEKGCLA